MANHIGRDGVVKIDGNTVAETRSWALDQSADTVEDTVMGDTWQSHKVTLKSWSASAEVFWDEDDAAQNALEVGASVALTLYPEGPDSGDTYWSGTALVDKLSHKAAHNGMIEATVSFKGTGALSKTTV